MHTCPRLQPCVDKLSGQVSPSSSSKSKILHMQSATSGEPAFTLRPRSKLLENSDEYSSDEDYDERSWQTTLRASALQGGNQGAEMLLLRLQQTSGGQGCLPLGKILMSQQLMLQKVVEQDEQLRLILAEPEEGRDVDEWMPPHLDPDMMDAMDLAIRIFQVQEQEAYPSQSSGAEAIFTLQRRGGLHMTTEQYLRSFDDSEQQGPTLDNLMLPRTEGDPVSEFSGSSVEEGIAALMPQQEVSVLLRSLSREVTHNGSTMGSEAYESEVPHYATQSSDSVNDEVVLREETAVLACARFEAARAMARESPWDEWRRWQQRRTWSSAGSAADGLTEAENAMAIL